MKNIWDRAFRRADALDKAASRAATTARTPSLDRSLALLSNLANYSRLWLGIAVVLAIGAGCRGRRAAGKGLLAVGVASIVANVGAKMVFGRKRPLQAAHREQPIIRLPASSSFPSGHTASAFAFVMATGGEIPLLTVPLLALAVAVGYSRIATGVHYAGDVLAGAILGSVVGAAVRGLPTKGRADATF